MKPLKLIRNAGDVGKYEKQPVSLRLPGNKAGFHRNTDEYSTKNSVLINT